MDKAQWEESQYRKFLELELKKSKEENEKLKEENRELRKQISDAGWRYEYDHRNDWRKPVEMGML